MRLIRFGAELTGTGLFTVGLFALPVAFALIGREVAMPAVAAPVPAAPVVHWTPPDPGGGLEAAEASNQGSDPIETGEDATSPAPAETPVNRPLAPPRGMPTFAEIDGRPASSRAGGHTSRGFGGGRGGGTGGVTMYRPAEHERPTAAPPVGTSSPQRGPRCEPQVDGIDSVGPSTWQVDRNIVDTYANLRHAKELVGWVARHEDRSGSMDGVQVGGIACGSPLSLAGIRNGDVIRSVNGIAIIGIPSALAAYRKLKKDDTLEVFLTRGGRPLHVTYRLV